MSTDSSAATTSTANTTTSTRTSKDSRELKEFNMEGIPLSASFTQVPATTPPNASYERNSIQRSFSENGFANPTTNSFLHSSRKSAFQYEEGATESDVYTNLNGNASTNSRAELKVTISKFTLGSDEEDIETLPKPEAIKSSVNGNVAKKRRSISGSRLKLARQSRSSPSRSPSPSKRADFIPRAVQPCIPTDGEKDNSQAFAAAASAASLVENGAVKGRPDDATIKRTKTRRPLSSVFSKGPSIPPLPKSLSTDQLPLSQAYTSTKTPPSLPNSKSFERLQANGTESPRRKDALWGAFRTLEGDFQKYHSKPSNSKCAIIRTSLLPFLRTHAEPLPNFTLRPEDLDHRIIVLNKWWTGLLELLNGRNGEAFSGSDRPAILEAVTAIMTRSEWNMIPSTSSLRSSRPSLKSRSTTSLGSNMSDFLAESVVHNVRNAYVQNLLSQMSYVVDKMSQRSASPSISAFCGKATAYAFFYCDGVAEILVRLWSLPSGALRAAAAANGVEVGDDLHPLAESLRGRFPLYLRNLAFSSGRTLERHLRSRPQVSFAISKIDWNSSWTGRWAGRDSDLFFSFTKSYYDLLSQHMPDDTTQKQRFCAPSYALVQAQILTLLSTTVQRTSGPPMNDPSRPPFDDPMAETDVSAPVLPASPFDMNRSMAENRLIMLLRDCLSSSAAIAPEAQELFAESFQSLAKAAASKISRFDHSSCGALCDFLEEALVILVRYYQSSNSRLSSLDWDFWFKVLKAMMESNNVMTEIRVCSFIYSLWGTIESSTRRKELCIDWLLSEETFEKQFTHWCPMVRAFYMRLLVWKVARLEERTILSTLLSRLNNVWRHLIWLQDIAQKQNQSPPSTAPCSPAPGRALVILKNDQPTTPGMFLSFDSILASTSNYASQATTNSTLSPTSADKSSNGGKRRWGILKSILPFGTSSGSSSSSRSSASVNGSSPSTSFANGHAIPPKTPHKPVPYRSHSFKFSLEFLGTGRVPNQDRELFPPKLPRPAQVFLDLSQDPTEDIGPREPTGSAAISSRYAGRALAEWALLEGECHNFFQRRKAEGVPDNSKVETPNLSVDEFRKPG